MLSVDYEDEDDEADDDDDDGHEGDVDGCHQLLQVSQAAMLTTRYPT